MQYLGLSVNGVIFAIILALIIICFMQCGFYCSLKKVVEKSLRKPITIFPFSKSTYEKLIESVPNSTPTFSNFANQGSNTPATLQVQSETSQIGGASGGGGDASHDLTTLNAQRRLARALNKVGENSGEKKKSRGFNMRGKKEKIALKNLKKAGSKQDLCENEEVCMIDFC